jgi:hypothetical protein
MLRCVTRPPARRQGPIPFRKIQVSDLLDLQILVVVLVARGLENYIQATYVLRIGEEQGLCV